LVTRHPPTSTLFPYTTLFRSAGEDLALGHAVAAADFRIIGKRRNGRLRVREGAPLSKGLAEDLRVADIADALALFEQVEIPIAVDRKSTRLNSSHVEISYAVF